MKDSEIINIAEKEYMKIPLKEKESKFISVFFTFRFAFLLGFRFCEKKERIKPLIDKGLI